MKDIKCKFTWMAIKVLEEDYFPEENNIYSINYNKGFYGNICSNKHFSYIALNLIPNATFYQTIINLFKTELNVLLKEKKPPFSVVLPQIGKISFSFTIRFSPPNVLTLIVKLSSFSIELNSLPKFTSTENFHIHFPPIYHFASWALGILISRKNKNFNLPVNLAFRPFIHIECPCEADNLRNHFDRNSNIYISTLIRSKNTNIEQSLVDSVMQKNKFHNRKSLSELILIDKQSVIYLTPASTKKEELWYHLFIGVFALYEIAYIFREILLLFFYLHHSNRNLSLYFLFILEKWVYKKILSSQKEFLTHQYGNYLSANLS